MKIWCLFSIDNAYDQPENNLVAFWLNKPSCVDIAGILRLNQDDKRDRDNAGKIWRGLVIRIGETDYRLEEIKEGVGR